MAASAGHNACLRFESDPIGDPGTYNVVTRMTADVPFPTLTSNNEDISAHQETVDSYVVSTLLRRDDITFEMAYDTVEATHIALLEVRLLNPPETRRFRFVGPLGVEPATDVIEIEAFVTAFTKVGPIDAGKYMATVTLRPTGPMIVDGVTFS